MNNRSRLLLSLCLPLALLGGCTSYYRNVEACKDKVRAEYPDAASAPLEITGSGASYHGARVVVRGEYPEAPKPLDIKTVKTATAAECTFSETTLTGFQWLAPAWQRRRLPTKPRSKLSRGRFIQNRSAILDGDEAHAARPDQRHAHHRARFARVRPGRHRRLSDAPSTHSTRSIRVPTPC
ncbi:hypothetical protein BUMB_03253 [Candidatus Paraburkholderia calva]|nr:hypothetical protein BUMB_03253 [Candidatus Paraburkholderia calva]